MHKGSIVGVMAGSLLVAGCSSGPPPITPGSPAFFWAVARESYRTGDLLKANTTLLELAQGESEFAARARTWHLVLSAGIAQGAWELADAYQAGSQITPARFRNEAAMLRSLAANTALEFTQAVRDRCEEESTEGAEETVLLAFGFPPGSADRPAGLDKISGGVWIGDAEREALERAMLERGVVRAVSTIIGRPEDTVKAAAVFLAQEVRIPRETYLYGVARLLFEESGLFDAKHLSRPDRLAVMYRETLEALHSIPETADTQALADKVQAALKGLPGA